MKYRHLTLIFVFLLAFMLSGCACSHEWTEADCVNPQVCTNCQETGEAALGHSWLDATCTEAQICSRCDATQGEAPGHNFGEWEFDEDLMSHSCSICAFEESIDIDRELYLETLLPGYWDFFGMYDDTGFIQASRLTLSGIEFHFGENKSATFSMPQEGAQQLTWSFDSYKHEDGYDNYYFTLTGETAAYPMCLRLNRSGSMNTPEKELILISGQLLMFSQYDNLRFDLVDDWGITSDQWGNILGNLGNWLTFRDDRTVVGNLNGTVDGIWHVVPVYTLDLSSPSEYIIMIENKAGDEAQLLKGTLSTSRGYSLDFVIGRSLQSFAPINEKALEQVKIASTIHLGTWTSTEIQYQGETERASSEYSVTFNADGSFTANLGKELSGTWGVRDISDAGDKIWTNGNDSPTYRYYMFVDGLDEIYCEVDARLDRKQFIIHNFELMDGRQINFVQYSEDEFVLMSQRDTYPIGTWFPSSYYVDNKLDGTRREDTQVENHPFIFHEDGRFTAVLEEEMTGSWEFEDLKFMDTSIGQYWEMDYLLTFDGKAEQMRIHIELREDGSEFFIYMPHPEKENFEIVAGFRKG